MSDNYLGNPNLKKTNVQQEFTAAQVEAYVKCSKDPAYFIEKYIKIVNLDEGFIPLKKIIKLQCIYLFICILECNYFWL